MQLQSIFKSGRTGALICGLVLATGIVKADEWDKRTILTIDQPIQITDTYLEPGTYVLKLVSSNADRHVVEIFDRDETHIINTLIAIPNYRLEPTGKSQFLFWETPPGTARAMRAWFYPGDNFGQEFRYPKNMRQIASASTTASVAAPAPTLSAPAAPSPEPEPVAQNQQSAVEEQTVIIAQNTAPAAPAPEVQPTPAEQPVPQELPKTASPFPLIGLAGLFSLSIFGWRKIKGTA